MDGDLWPDPHAEFGLPDSADAERWRDMIDRALLEGSLVLHELRDRELFLEGTCPRCGHRLRPRSLAAEVAGNTRTIRVVCDCDHRHPGRLGGTRGCGWAPGVAVPIASISFESERSWP